MRRNWGITAVLLAALAGCGTTYELPSVGDDQNARANRMFAEARADTSRATLSTSSAEARFNRVAQRIAPVGRSTCEQMLADRPGFNCNVDIQIDRQMKDRNAYFTYKSGAPVIRVSMPLLQDTGSDDEAAFVISHEYGHLIGRHIEKQQQQMVAGALILGGLAAAVGAQGGGGYNRDLVNAGVEIGATAGSVAYSQSYELESDTIGTRIAHAAGYDPVVGARFFARPEAAQTTQGQLSFWGTHPPDEKRFATVLATVDQINANVGLRRTVR
jgi:Zn-dependent protease with chaperone function